MYEVNYSHLDAYLTNFSLEYKNSGFVAGEIFTFTKVAKESDKYIIYGKEKLRIPELIRGPSAEYARIKQGFSDDSYSCAEYGLEVPIDDRERDNADKPLNPDEDATNLSTDVLLLAWEKRVIDIVTSTAYITNNTTLSGTSQWSDPNSDPITNIKTGKTTIMKAIGQRPNALIISEDVMDALADHPDIQEKIKYTQKGVVTPDLLAGLLNLDRVLVAYSIYNSAIEGAAESISFLWGKDALLAYINPNAGLKGMTLGKTFGTVERVTERYREDKVRSDIVRALHVVDEKLVCATAGYLIKAAAA